MISFGNRKLKWGGGGGGLEKDDLFEQYNDLKVLSSEMDPAQTRLIP
jgi:hypothetical protein